MELKSIGFAAVYLSIIFSTPHKVIAQDQSSNAAVIESEGISGDIDKKRRGPAVSVRTEYVPASNGSAESMKILADAYIPSPDYQKYPIKFEWYINRTLFTTQWRSEGLPGPIGIDVPASVATIPFNYTLVATLLHPNREFTTVIEGAAFATNVGTTFSCSLAKPGTEPDVSLIYVDSKASVTQTGNNSLTLSFSSSTLDDGTEADAVTANASISVSDQTSSGELTVNSDSAVAVSGTATSSNGSITAFSVQSEDQSLDLTCEATS